MNPGVSPGSGARIRSRPTPARRALLALFAATALVGMAAGEAAALSPDAPHQSHGNRGVNIRALQHLLRQHGATLPVSGLFDTPTVVALRSFQWGHGLPGTGQADARTWTVLEVTLSAGSRGEAVLAAQRLLNEKRRAGLALTGTYDAPTQAAVLAFQGHARIGKTGVVGPVTWRALLAHLELPVWGTALCDYSVGNGTANWGTAAAIGQLEAAAAVVAAKGHGRVALGDIGYEHGGDIAGHVTHEHGLDVDVRPLRTAKDQCRLAVNYRSSAYDRAATRELVKAVRATALNHVQLIYFNDPVLIREGLTTWYSGHDDHLHIRYCERDHPVAAYDC